MKRIHIDLTKIPETISLKGEIQTGDVWLNLERIIFPDEFPNGFRWGNAGNGADRLSLAILLKYFNKDTSLSLYQEFKWQVIASLPNTDFFKTINLRKEIKKILFERKRNRKQSNRSGSSDRYLSQYGE